VAVAVDRFLSSVQKSSRKAVSLALLCALKSGGAGAIRSSNTRGAPPAWLWNSCSPVLREPVLVQKCTTWCTDLKLRGGCLSEEVPSKPHHPATAKFVQEHEFNEKLTEVPLKLLFLLMVKGAKRGS
jgi:hypothetical protein